MANTGKSSPDDVKRIIRSVEIFGMLLDEHLDEIVAAGNIERLARGQMLFRRDDPPDRIHVILRGAIEIVRETPDHPEPVPVAYISPGEVIGDMALFTGSVRRSSGRVPERAEVWTMTRETFERLGNGIPGYGIQLTKVFAKRLESFISTMRRQARRKELSGKLRHFDMPTVVQTLITSNQTGVLTILDEEGHTVAEVLIRNGAVDRARCGKLQGEEAFFEIFLRGADGEFLFRTVAEPDPEAVSKAPIELSAMNLLMEAMRFKDELPALKARLPDGDGPYEQAEEDLTWEDARTEHVARAIFDRLAKPTKLGSLVGEVACCTFTLYEVAERLARTRQIE